MVTGKTALRFTFGHSKYFQENFNRRSRFKVSGLAKVRSQSGERGSLITTGKAILSRLLCLKEDFREHRATWTGLLYF